jgi:hypothetical protein
VLLAIKQTEYDGHTVHYCTISAEAGGASVAWAFVQEPLDLRPDAADRRRRGRSRSAHATRPRSILAHRDVPGRRRAKLPADAMSFGYFNSQYIARMFYPLLNLAVNSSMAQLARFGVELRSGRLPADRRLRRGRARLLSAPPRPTRTACCSRPSASGSELARGRAGRRRVRARRSRCRRWGRRRQGRPAQP